MWIEHRGNGVTAFCFSHEEQRMAEVFLKGMAHTKWCEKLMGRELRDMEPETEKLRQTIATGGVL